MLSPLQSCLFNDGMLLCLEMSWLDSRNRAAKPIVYLQSCQIQVCGVRKSIREQRKIEESIVSTTTWSIGKEQKRQKTNAGGRNSRREFNRVRHVSFDLERAILKRNLTRIGTGFYSCYLFYSCGRGPSNASFQNRGLDFPPLTTPTAEDHRPFARKHIYSKDMLGTNPHTDLIVMTSRCSVENQNGTIEKNFGSYRRTNVYNTVEEHETIDNAVHSMVNLSY